MSIPVKTLARVLLPMQSIANGIMVFSSPLAVTDLLEALLWVRLGRTVATALTASPQFNVEGSTHASDDYGWQPLWTPFMSSDPSFDLAASEAEAVSGTVAADATTITVASTTNLVNGDRICLSNGASSEIRIVKAVVANVSLTVDKLVGAATGLTLYDQAQQIPINLDLKKVKRIRGVVANNSGQTILAEMLLNTFDAIT